MISDLHSSEGEVWILSGLLTGGRTYLDEYLSRLNLNHFYSRFNQIVFNTIVDLYETSSAVDAVTVSQKLRDRGQLEDLGGDYFVHKLAASAPTTANADYWISILDGKKLLRESVELFSWADREIRTAEDIPAFISDLESKVLNLKKTEDGGNLLIPSSDAALLRNEKILGGVKNFGIECGLPPIDSTLGGLCPAQLLYVCARAGKGKTAMLEQIFENLLSQERPILVFQRDMPVDIMIERMACRAASVSYFVYRRGVSLREENLRVKHEFEKLKRLQDKLIIRSPFRLTAQDLLSIVRKDKNKYGVEAVFLDHIQNIDIQEKDFREGLTRASSTIRRSAQDSNLPHVIIAQLNREAQEGRPKASHVKEFDGAYADCDAMVMLWSTRSQTEIGPGEYLPVKFTFVKNRHGPETEEEMLFDGSLMKFKTEADLKPDPEPQVELEFSRSKESGN
jgi:replicative DNA helicase